MPELSKDNDASWRRIASSISIQYFGRVISLLVSLASVGILTRYLGVDSYGEYTSALSIAALVVTFSDFGFFWSTIQNFVGNENQKESLQEILGIRTITTTFLIAISLLFVWFGDFSIGVKQAFTVLTIFIFSSSLNNILAAIYQAEYKMKWPTIVDFLSRIVNLAIVISGIYLHRGLIWFIVGAALAAFTNFIINWIGIRRNKGVIKLKIRGISWKKYYQSVFLVGLMSLFSALYYKIDVVMLSWMKESFDVGIYGVAQKIIELIMMFQALFVASLFPLLVAKHKVNRDEFVDVARKAQLILTSIGFPIVAFCIIMAKDIVSIISGPSFVTASNVIIAGHQITTPLCFSILLIFVALSYFDSAFTIGLLASENVRRLVGVNFLATILNIVANFFLIPHYSYVAAAVITVLTELLIFFANGIFFIRYYKYQLPIKEFSLIIVSIIPGVLFLNYLARDWNFLVKAPMAFVIYALCLILLMPNIKSLIMSLKKARL